MTTLGIWISYYNFFVVNITHKLPTKNYGSQIYFCYFCENSKLFKNNRSACCLLLNIHNLEWITFIKKYSYVFSFLAPGSSHWKNLIFKNFELIFQLIEFLYKDDGNKTKLISSVKVADRTITQKWKNFKLLLMCIFKYFITYIFPTIDMQQLKMFKLWF
jgi:hypothetical protein